MRSPLAVSVSDSDLQRFPVHPCEFIRDPFDRKTLPREVLTSHADVSPLLGAQFDHTHELLGQRDRRVRRDQEPAAAVSYEFRNPSDVCGHDRQAREHCFDDGHGKVVRPAREAE